MVTEKTVLVIGGPTASGKSGLAMAVASAMPAVIINGDSMQVYQGLPLLTAQPSAEDFKKAPHRLYAALSPDTVCSAAKWREMALKEIDGAHAENKLPVVVGGTGFYLKTLLKGLSPIPDVLPGVRERISALQKKMGNPAFHQALAERDPAMAARLDPFNTQRLVRAWEVLEGTGRSLAEWQDLPPAAAPAHLRFVTATLLPPKEPLYAACDRRLEEMLKNGALEEVRAFREKAPPASPLQKALGYPEFSAHLEGKITLEEALQAAKQTTRRYAKRQMTWFRHQIAADIHLATPDPKAVLKFLLPLAGEG